MLRFFFWTLLIINGLLLALNLGWLGDWSMDSRETHRLKAQKNTERLKIVPASVAQDIQEKAAKKAEPKIACLEIANVLLADGKSFDEKLKDLALGSRISKTELAEVATNMVYLPPLANKDAADKKAAQLIKLGITEVFVVQDQSPLRWGISFGVFKTSEAAKTHQANLIKKGIKDVRIAPRAVSAAKLSYRLFELTQEEKLALDKIQEQFPNSESHECKPKTEVH